MRRGTIKMATFSRAEKSWRAEGVERQTEPSNSSSNYCHCSGVISDNLSESRKLESPFKNGLHPAPTWPPPRRENKVSPRRAGRLAKSVIMAIAVCWRVYLATGGNLSSMDGSSGRLARSVNEASGED